MDQHIYRLTQLSYYQQKSSDNLRDFIATAIREDGHTVFWAELTKGYHSLFSIALSALLAIPLAGNSIANMMFFTMLANLILEQSKFLEAQFQQLIKTYVSFSHVDSLLNLPKRQTGHEERPFSSITFRDVSFSYPNGTQALKKISCDIHSGDFIRLAGLNGSGKSSFIKLFTGLYQPNTGEILLDSVLLSRYAQDKLNQYILYVSQDEKLLNETFQKYLSIISGKPLDQKEFLELLNYVQLPTDGRAISGNGNSLSVGQGKKLLILKLLLRLETACVIILDELTAGLDVDTAHQVFDLVQKIAASGNKIILFVDHNCEQEMHFTHTFYFENGELHID